MPAKLPIVLLFTRLSIFLFMLPWQMARFAKPEQIDRIAQKYYKFPVSEIASKASGLLMMALIIAMVLGFKKRLSYGLVFVLHTVGTIMTVPYLIPGTENFNPLFLAAIPTVAAMALLYTLRDHDTLLTIDK